jgi:membrane protease subunit HflC
MKRNYLSVAVGVVLLVIFASLLVSFQVRQTEVAVVTTFGEASSKAIKAGLHFKLPWPIQKVVKFDSRVQNFEEKFEETPTQDGKNLLIMVYAGWRIVDPGAFLKSFPTGGASAAESTLESWVRSSKNAVVGKHQFSDFVSTDAEKLKFTQIENEILEKVKAEALNKAGIDVAFLGIKRLGLPESASQRVFDRMREERMRLVNQYQGEGEAQAISIRTSADRDREEIISKAEKEAIRIRGEGDAEAAKSLAEFEKDPELAVFLLRLDALEKTLRDRSTLIFDERTPPFDMLNKQVAPVPARKP